MAESILSGVNRSLANMIPLIMRKQQMDWEREKWDARQSEKEEELLLDAEKVKFETGKQIWLEGQKSGNQGMAQTGGPMMEKFMPGLNLPKETISGQPQRGGGDDLMRYTVPEKEEKDKPFNIEQKLYEAAGGNIDEYIALKQRLKATKGDKKQELNTYMEAAIYHMEKGNVEQAKKYQELAKVAKKESTSSTPDERKRTKLEDDIQQVLSQLGGVESGQNIMTEALGSEKGSVVKRKKKRLATMLSNYDKSYGAGSAKKRFGIESKDFEIPKDVMKQMPPAAEHKGKVVRDTETGIRYKSDGKNWNEIE